MGERTTNLKKAGPRIATVRIAPVERWCPEAAGYDFKESVREVLLRRGKVSFLTESMERHPHGKRWMVEPKFQASVDEEAGEVTRCAAYVCEHMLEMD